ncbi:MAG: divalent-cation tolerance protein CutA [Methanomicrobiaceae archaeon]|uniref:Periplasmic divalent cation tolerance protein cuta n=1 Tax=hydrocarbon metagenome TaxID=938273 RepID=A0A0W8FHM6_9ZZZZ|nr:divalent-cation tolerance protein CutA [Methanomicrobiaceae archaeon]MDD5420497.1 divalent-cation tolerance protein CutA [Methanomicrobiaceae archaeon]
MVCSECVVIYCTAPPGEAASIGKALVTEKLAACANIVEVRSIFAWQNEICEEQEHLLIIKTQSALLDRITERIRELHTYDLPEIIALPIVAGYAPYLDWVQEETAG